MTEATSSTPFNVADFEARDTAVLDFDNIKGDGPLLLNGSPVQAVIRSPGTKEAMAAQHKIDTSTNAKMYAGMRGKVVAETVDGNIAQRAAKLSAVTLEFINFPMAPKDVFENPKLGWMTEQVAKFHGEWANF